MTERVMTLAFVDVGQGDATIILPPAGEGDAIVVDCGRHGWEVVQQLKTWKIDRLAAVVVTHFDLDHIGGVGTLIGAYRDEIGAFFVSQDRDVDEDADAKNAQKLCDEVVSGEGTAQQPGWMVRTAEQGAVIGQGKDWSVELLAPRGGRRLDAERHGFAPTRNLYSAVVRVRMGDKVALIGGDAPLRVWSELQADALPARVFRLPHHGGALDESGVPKGWSAKRLYDDVGAKEAVLSVGTNNDHGHPVLEWIDPLRSSKCRLSCTQVTPRCHPPLGDKIARDHVKESFREALRFGASGSDHFAEIPWRHLADESGKVRMNRPEIPCAGTITVRITDDGDMTCDPRSDHASFAARITRWDAALCRET